MKKSIVAVAAMALAISALAVHPALADPTSQSSASAYGLSLDLAGNEVIPPTPTASATFPPGGNDSHEVVIDVPADPLAISATLIADAQAHIASDIPTSIENEESAQSVPGPYNARGVGQVEGLEVLVNVVDSEAQVSLIEADLVRAEAAAVCSAGAVQYTGTSEVVALEIGGELLPLNAPLQDIIDAIGDVLEQTGLEAVVDVERNVVTPLDGGGIAVDALVVTLLAGTVEGQPLGEIRIAHAEVGPAACLGGQIVTVTKDGPATVAAGQSFDYTITVANTGCPVDATLTTVTDRINGPAGSTVTATDPAGATVAGDPAGAGILVTWTDQGTLAPGASKVFTVTVAVPAGATGTYEDNAFAQLVCGGTPFEDTDTIVRPEIEGGTLSRTGGETTLMLSIAGIGLVGALLLRRTRRGALA
jgi:uncharacterized repeat protein (TIGR01451 family)